jgi:hypothetical protein
MFSRRDGEIDSVKDDMPAGANLDARKSDRYPVILASRERLNCANLLAELISPSVGLPGGSSHRRRGVGFYRSERFEKPNRLASHQG